MPQAKCDRCDGPHPSTECPAFRWGRHDHPDAQCMPIEERPQITPAAAPIEAAGALIKQPGDGSCLYRSLICGECRLGRRSCGVVNLREQLAAWVKRNGSTRFYGQSVEQWMQAELGSSMTVKEYAKRQSRGGWGGSIEYLAFVISKKTTVWVWIPIGHGPIPVTSHAPHSLPFSQTLSFGSSQKVSQPHACFQQFSHRACFLLMPGRLRKSDKQNPGSNECGRRTALSG